MESVLVIDDDRLIQRLLGRLLGEHYDLSFASSGEEGVKIAASLEPSVILLDIEMPGLNGYQTCARLRDLEHCMDTPVVFLSSHSSIKERLHGYEVGGDDYIVKPFDAKELFAKISLLVTQSVQRRQLVDSADSAQATAVEAMATSFELGKAVRFVELSYLAKDYDELALQLLRFCNELDLHVALMFITRRGSLFYSSSQETVPPLEADVLTLLHSQQRFSDFGQRTQVNYKHSALLVKNMPAVGSAKYGRVKDVIPFVLGAADTKVRILDAERGLSVQRAELSASIATVNMSLDTLNESFSRNLNTVTSTMSDLVSTLSLELRNMGMEQDQEDWVLDKVENASEKIAACIENNVNTKKVLVDVLDLLQKITSEQDKILQESLNVEQPCSKSQLSGDDIELF
ncbi:PleD family two-component system response regulator [Agaribacterium sp. ZY112]|uniref:response regulator n=1 Tax=Agaribacterium sp. ZY112 TaxID=3233574 RepID=UPI00352380B1